MKKPLFLILLLAITPYLQGGFYEESKIEGFYFFEDPKKEKTKKTPPKTPEEAVEIIAEQKLELYRLRCLAILSPNRENLSRYIEEQNRLIDLAGTFATKWQYLLLDLPELGGGIEGNTSFVAIETRKKVVEKKKLQTLDALRENYFLLLFVNGDDLYCEEAAKILKQFEEVSSWEVRTISLNGIPTKAFSHGVFNQGLAKKYGIKKVPTFLMMNPETKEAFPVGLGVLSIADLVDNIFAQAKRHQIEEMK